LPRQIYGLHGSPTSHPFVRPLPIFRSHS
jgi:hypothetical protein